MQVDVHEISQSRLQTLVDTRPRAERFGDLGFIPGSRWFPEDDLRRHSEDFVREVSRDRPVVLACLTGRRSVGLVPLVSAMGYPQVFSLRGGLLAWAAVHPVCTLRAGPPADAAVCPDELKRQIAACFVAESVENTLHRGLDEDFNPKAVVDAFVQQAYARHANPRDALVEVLERLSEVAYRRGHGLDTIANNVDRLLGLVDAL